ncbi:glycosyltransferase involved in cell wall biosynthesis [Algoriphagus sp. 4150]|uniref:glycosyltransferase family 4 protein n=1 Tax=Algoriphagus sp. 4150 TaxID=2817756 RepID=UPI00285A59B1|nr:glycosyltransferase family 4 protein [Algoriphagus sp. 4150]MDR7130552.1 glycosyltransferase involved in cell wall biosynthesis [Algoriphagus sp. 4150]
MKVGIVTYALMIGGVERVILNLYKGFKLQGLEPTVIEVDKKGLWSEKFESMGVKVVRILPRPYESKVSHAYRVLTHLREYQLLFLNDVPCVQSILGLLPESTRIFPIVHGNLDSMLYNASFNLSQVQSVISVSELLADRLTDEYGVNADLVHVIENGLDIPKISLKTIENRNKKFVFLGRFANSEKGVLDIPEIFHLLSDKLGDICVDFYGEGPDREELIQRINDNGLEDSLHIKDPIAPEKVYEVLSAYDFLLFPSKFEGSPLVIKEGMVCGLIPLAYRLVGQTDVIVEHGENGFLATPGNTAEFAANILEIYNDPDRVLKMREKAIRTIVEKYSIDTTIASYMKVIKKGMDAPKAKRTQVLEKEILGDFPSLPQFLIRPVRKTLRTFGFYK